MDLSVKVPGHGVSKSNEEMSSTAAGQIPWETGVTGQWSILRVTEHCQQTRNFTLG